MMLVFVYILLVIYNTFMCVAYHLVLLLVSLLQATMMAAYLDVVEDNKKIPVADESDGSCETQFIETVPCDNASDFAFVEVKQEEVDDIKVEFAEENDIENPHHSVKVRVYVRSLVLDKHTAWRNILHMTMYTNTCCASCWHIVFFCILTVNVINALLYVGNCTQYSICTE